MGSVPQWLIEPIRRDHVRESFDCGIDELSLFLRKYARQSEGLGLARTFVAVGRGEREVLGYYTIRSGEVEVLDLPPEDTKRFPRYPVPVVHLARLAVARSAQGQGLGEHLLLDALERSLVASRSVAAYAVEVVAINEGARRFYLKYGFQELLGDRLHLYLPMKTLAALFKKV